MRLDVPIRRAFAQGVSDHRHCVLFQELAATSPTTSWIQSNKKCSKFSNTFFNTFWLTFVSTLTNWTELLNFHQPFYFCCTDSSFFRNKSKTMPNNCSNSCFLFEMCVREGGFRGAIRLVVCPPPALFEIWGFLFLDWFPGASFFDKKCIWGATLASKPRQN